MGIVGDRTVGINGDGHRTHPQETKSYQAKRKYRRSCHQGFRYQQGYQESDSHQTHNGDSQPVSGHIAGNHPGQNIQRSTTLTRGFHGFPHETRFGGGKYFHQFGNQGSRESTAGHDGRQFQPQVVALFAHHKESHQENQYDAQNRSQPDQRRQRGFKVHAFRVPVTPLDPHSVDGVGQCRTDNHRRAYRKDPHQQQCLNGGVWNCQNDVSHQSHAGDAVGFKAVSGRAHRVSSIVPGAVGDDPGVTRVVLVNFEHDFHEVRTDIGNLGKDTTCDTQGGRP